MGVSYGHTRRWIMLSGLMTRSLLWNFRRLPSCVLDYAGRDLARVLPSRDGQASPL